MSLQMVRFRTDSDNIAQVRSELERVFTALRATSPPGLIYTAYASMSEPEFVLVLELEDGAPNALLGLPEAVQLRERIAQWSGAPVPPQAFTTVGSYGS